MPITSSEPDYVSSAIADAERAFRSSPGHPHRARPSRGRIDVLVDEGDRETLAACGAAVLNMQLALRAAGHAATVDVFPDHTRPELAAVVWIRATCTASARERALASAIRAPHDRQGPLPEGAVPLSVRTALVQAAAREEAELVLLDPAPDVSLLERRLADAGWLTGDSVGGLLAVLNSHTDTLRGQVQAGRALQRVLLTANVQGAPVEVLLRPDAVQKARPELRGFLGGQANPQAVLAFGYPPAALPVQRHRLS